MHRFGQMREKVKGRKIEAVLAEVEKTIIVFRKITKLRKTNKII